MDHSREQFKTNRGRCADRDALNQEIQSKLNLNWSMKDLVKEMSRDGIPFSEIKSTADLLEDPDFKSMGITHKVDSQKYSIDGK